MYQWWFWVFKSLKCKLILGPNYNLLLVYLIEVIYIYSIEWVCVRVFVQFAKTGISALSYLVQFAKTGNGLIKIRGIAQWM